DREGNYGFTVRSVGVNTSDSVISFRSRESARPPELSITYFDSRVYSVGRSQTQAEIFVWRSGISETLTEIEVSSVYGSSDVLSEIYVHRYEVPVSRDVEAEITVSKPVTLGELTVSLQDKNSILTEIIARSETIPDTKEAEIAVSKPFQFAE